VALASAVCQCRECELTLLEAACRKSRTDGRSFLALRRSAAHPLADCAGQWHTRRFPTGELFSIPQSTFDFIRRRAIMVKSFACLWAARNPTTAVRRFACLYFSPSRSLQCD
jgi:hypothetical protein